MLESLRVTRQVQGKTVPADPATDPDPDRRNFTIIDPDASFFRLSASDKSLHKKDFVKAAQADGFSFAVRLDRKEDVPRVVEEFIRYPGPAFLEVIIDPDAGVYPMVGPGQSYDAMITGDFIVPRNKQPVEAAAPGPSQMF